MLKAAICATLSIIRVINIMTMTLFRKFPCLVFVFHRCKEECSPMSLSFLVMVTAQFIFFIYPLIRNQWQSLWHLSPNTFNSISQQLHYRSSQSSGYALPAPLSFVSSFYIPFHPFCGSSEQENATSDILWVQESHYTASHLLYIRRVLAHWIARVAFVNKLDI